MKVDLISKHNPEIFAFETVPALEEVSLIHEVMSNKSEKYYVSVQAKLVENSLKMGHGELIKDFINLCLKTENSNLQAIGLNCCHSNEPLVFVKEYFEALG